MSAEKSRLSPNSAENPLGEDSIRVKIRQLEELFQGTAITWELILDTHNSRDKSDEVARELLQADDLRKYYESKQAVVLTINQPGPTMGKGGKVVYGMNYAISSTDEHPIPADVVVYSDTDTATDLRFTGLLLGGMMRGKIVDTLQQYYRTQIDKLGDIPAILNELALMNIRDRATIEKILKQAVENKPFAERRQNIRNTIHYYYGRFIDSLIT